MSLFRPGTLCQQLSEKNAQYISPDKWRISVLMEDISGTGMEQLQLGAKWDHTLTVDFIGEEGVDAGGLRRQFLTSFYRSTPLLEHGTLSHSALSLQREEYLSLGKLIAYGLLIGHPGMKFIRFMFQCSIEIPRINAVYYFLN